ncbi:hypothetical protein NYZ65_18840, partial [Acinetobacter baumannii]|nr:hypothetical protein [Acinetobacter baumannii]
ADTATHKAVHELAEVKARLKVLEEREEYLKFRIVDFMRPNAFLTIGGHEIASWKNQFDTRLDEKALKEEMPEIYEKYKRTKEIRVLRLKKGKS